MNPITDFVSNMSDFFTCEREFGKFFYTSKPHMKKIWKI